MSGPSSLAELEAQFYALVTAPESVAKTLAARGQTPSTVEAFIRGNGKLSAVARLDVYANMYFFRILDVLREDYPKVVSVVGDEAFHNFVTDYLLACPPAHPSIANAGERLPRFLATHPLAAARPWLPALAALERTYRALFDGPDATPLTLDEVRSLSPEEIMELTLGLIPCHRWLEHSYALDPLWHRLDRGEGPSEPAEDSETLLVWRHGIAVHHRVLPPEELALLRLIDGRRSLRAICDELTSGSVEEVAQQIFNALGRWIQEELLVSGRA